MIDILLALYNGEKYLREQLDSIAGQTFQDWHLLIGDDGSTDGSLSVARQFAREHPGKVEILSGRAPSGGASAREPADSDSCKEPPGGASANFMRMIGEATSPYVMFCDQDDVWLPEKIEKTWKVMRLCEHRYGDDLPILVHTDLCVVDAHLKTIAVSLRDYQKLPRTTALRQLLIQNSVTGCTVMINRRLAEMMRRSMDVPEIVMHDYWAALIATVFGRIAFIHQPLILYRQHGRNSVGAQNAAGFLYLYRRMRAGRAEFRKRLNDTARQAGAFSRVFSEELRAKPQKTLIEKYANLTNFSKIKKIYFYFSNRIWKYGIIRKIMQIVWS